ncbi:adenine nucleotide alpha hydrolase family protein [Geovibrio thiophilus]|uniref:Adenine nucleotide alpha hydrolase family protein n=1 Tax=Geovibrio thiophilus TaxID=139438 RepID=A0A3R5X3U6_9BACT|nr:ATP-binding protein [Geovibrio thiophilus]QAR33842.1 adenine nucleotide alpha hydrolase family protein [Geovibrio thiophilus]
MKCVKCNGNAVINIRRANAAFCKEHFNEYFTEQTLKSIKQFRMFRKTDKIMVCVSGGKDSLVLWHVLHNLGCDVTGMYIDLGINGYSDRSKEKVTAFADKFGLKTIIVDLREKGYPIPFVARRAKREDCAVCGTIKRYYFNRAAYDGGFDVVATGHNLDDEASRLLANIMHWNDEYMDNTYPVLPAGGKMLKKKVKPLVRLTERETAAFAILNGIDYVMEECPMSKGATSLIFKEALSTIEDKMAGTEIFFYTKFLERVKDKDRSKTDSDEMKICQTCGMESFMDKCTFCRLVEKVK